jgi:hypothetical protein
MVQALRAASTDRPLAIGPDLSPTISSDPQLYSTCVLSRSQADNRQI